MFPPAGGGGIFQPWCSRRSPIHKYKQMRAWNLSSLSPIKSLVCPSNAGRCAPFLYSRSHLEDPRLWASNTDRN